MLVAIKNFLDEKTVFENAPNASNRSDILLYSYDTMFNDHIEIKAREMEDKTVEIYLVESVMNVDDDPLKVSSSDEFIEWFNTKFSMFLK